MQKQDNNQLKYFMYCRKSTEDNQERQAQSIESQQRELDIVVKREGLKVIRRFQEEKSAHTTGRGVFAEMIKGLERGEANGILVWHANRLTRNMTDGAVIVALMDSGIIKEVKTPGRVYSSDSMDKFTIILEFGLSKKDSDDKSDVVKRGLKTKCEKGSMPGLAPLGYLNTPELIGGSRYIKIDPERFDVLKQIWEMMATGQYAVSQLHEKLNKEFAFKTRLFKRQGDNAIRIGRLYKMFRDPFYYGEFEYPKGSGSIYSGSHDPMINKETFNAVQRVLDGNTKTRSKTREFAFTGIMRCKNCNAQITAEHKERHYKNGNTGHFIYYRCTRRIDTSCKEKSVPLRDLQPQIEAYVSRISVPESFEEWAIKWLKVLYQQELETADLLTEKNDKKVQELEKEYDRALSLYMSPENTDQDILSATDLASIKKRVKGQIASLVGGNMSIQEKLDAGILKCKKDFNFATYALKWLEQGTLAEQRSILSGLGCNLTLSNQKLDIILKKPFEILSDSHDDILKEVIMLEPNEMRLEQRKTDTFVSASPLLLRRRDSNPRPWVMSPVRYRSSTPLLR